MQQDAISYVPTILLIYSDQSVAIFIAKIAFIAFLGIEVIQLTKSRIDLIKFVT
jgi:hypothetical protein